jgi:uncharacterized protein (TIGR02246 family)
MNWKRLLLLDVLIAFLALTTWAILARGAAMIDDLWSPTGLLLSVDLTIALTMAVVWVWRDARSRGVSPIPYVALTLLTGSAGPLLYLLRRESAGGRVPAGMDAARVPGALLLLVLALATVGSETGLKAAPPGTGAAQGSSAGIGDEAAIRALAAQMTEAWNRGDPRGFAAAFVEDGELISGDGTRAAGRREIERYTAHLLTKPSRFSSEVIDVRFIDRDVALLMSDGGFLSQGETVIAPEKRGIQSFVVRRDAGQWRVVLLQRTRLRPPAVN